MVVGMCTGCQLGDYRDDPGSLGGQGGTSSGDQERDEIDQPSSPSENEGSYTVTLLYKNTPFYPNGEEINVIWHGQNDDRVVKLNDDGTADAGELDGDYDIYLSGLPEEYSYNPNIYYATADKRNVIINIVDIETPVIGDGGVNANPSSMAIYRDGGCYVVKYQGTYRVTVEKDQILYFEYQPQTSGKYSVESWCNIYEDSVNPIVDIYSGTLAYKWYTESRDTGGPTLDGGYTKNFRYEINIANVGPTYTFGIKAVSKTGEYPVTVEFAITNEGPYESASDVIKIKYSEEADGLDAPEAIGTYKYADLGTKLFNLSVKLDPDKGVYRLYNSQTNTYGAYLCASITSKVPCYPTTSLYEANHIGGSSNNYLKLREWSDEYGEMIIYDYTDFIRVSYAGVCNDDGVCYVTEELKEFLQLYAVRHNLWTDNEGTTEGTPEDNEYGADQDNLWLFACGFYEQ